MNIISYLENKPILTIILVVGIMLLFTIGSVDVSIMEARNFISAREMLQDGNYLLTTINGEPRYEKPPLPTWLTAISASLFGLKHLLALRLPAILMIIIVGITSYWFSKHLMFTKLQSLANGLVTVTTLYILVITIEAPWDIFAHGFMFLGLMGLYVILKSHTTNWKLVFLSSIAIGFSILSKGPVSLYVLFFPFIISYAFTYGLQAIKTKFSPLIITFSLGFIIGASWYLYVYIIDHDAFISMFSQETSNWKNYNVKPFYYYWNFFTLTGIWTIPAFISLLYPFFKSKVTNKKAYKFTFLWTLITILFLSFILEKKSRYAMPALLPLALNVGFVIQYFFRRANKLNGKELGIVNFNFGLLGLVSLCLPLVGFFLLKDKADVNWIIYVLDSVIIICLGILMFQALIKKKVKQQFFLTIVLCVAFGVIITPYHQFYKNADYQDLSELKNILHKSELKLYGYGYVSPEALWDYGNKLEIIKTSKLPSEDKFGIISTYNDPECDSILKLKYHIEQVDYYDMNFLNSDSKKHKDRLCNEFYIASKK